jgi:hypothetical protein
VYIHFVEGKAPLPLTLGSPFPAGSSGDPAQASATDPDGKWNVSTDSVVGYRAREVLFGQSNVAVGRATHVAGSITVNGPTVTGGTFTVDMAPWPATRAAATSSSTVGSWRRAPSPRPRFTLTQPIELGSIPARRGREDRAGKGKLTLHGMTRTITFEVTGRYTGAEMQVAGSIPITFADWNIPDASFGGLVTAEDHSVLEFALNFTHGGSELWHAPVRAAVQPRGERPLGVEGLRPGAIRVARGRPPG